MYQSELFFLITAGLMFGVLYIYMGFLIGHNVCQRRQALRMAAVGNIFIISLIVLLWPVLYVADMALSLATWLGSKYRAM